MVKVSGRRDFALLRWWGKVVSMDAGRLCHAVYQYRKENAKENRSGWCKRAKELLEELNLADIWFSEEIGD